MRGEFVDLGGVRVYCYAFGSRGVGEPIVLVHGAFTSSHLWQDLLPRLPKGHRVLVLDLLGHGRSDPPRHAAMTLAAHADRLAALLDVMGVNVATLVGHGFGAAIAARVATLHPSRVTRLVLANPTMLARDPRDARVSRRIARLAALVPVWRRLGPEWLASALHGALLTAYAQKSSGAHSLDHYLKSFRTRDGRDAACAQLVAFRDSRDDAGAALVPGAIRCPVALALGVSDPMLPAAVAARLESALGEASGGRLVVQRLSGVSHVAPEEAPDRLGTIIADFMTQQPPFTDSPNP
ncbi:MAG: alpha/beta hydrolase [Gemmatimonadota bacterium]